MHPIDEGLEIEFVGQIARMVELLLDGGGKEKSRPRREDGLFGQSSCGSLQSTLDYAKR